MEYLPGLCFDGSIGLELNMNDQSQRVFEAIKLPYSLLYLDNFIVLKKKGLTISPLFY